MSSKISQEDHGSLKSAIQLIFKISLIFNPIKCMLWGGPVVIIVFILFLLIYVLRNLTEGFTQKILESGTKKLILIQKKYKWLHWASAVDSLQRSAAILNSLTEKFTVLTIHFKNAFPLSAESTILPTIFNTNRMRREWIVPMEWAMPRLRDQWTSRQSTWVFPADWSPAVAFFGDAVADSWINPQQCLLLDARRGVIVRQLDQTWDP